MRDAARRLGTFRVSDLADAVGIQTYQGRRRVRMSINDFLRRGEFRRVSRGQYAYVALPQRRRKSDVIWHLVRSTRHFGIDEIEQLSGAPRTTVRKYLWSLVVTGHLRKTSRRRYRLVNDTGPDTPPIISTRAENGSRAERGGQHDPDRQS